MQSRRARHISTLLGRVSLDVALLRLRFRSGAPSKSTARFIVPSETQSSPERCATRAATAEPRRDRVESPRKVFELGKRSGKRLKQPTIGDQNGAAPCRATGNRLGSSIVLLLLLNALVIGGWFAVERYDHNFQVTRTSPARMSNETLQSVLKANVILEIHDAGGDVVSTGS